MFWIGITEDVLGRALKKKGEIDFLSFLFPKIKTAEIPHASEHFMP